MGTQTHSSGRAGPLTGLSVLLGASTLALVAVLALVTEPPVVGTVAVFGLLFLFAENIDLDVPSGAGLSSGFMVAIAALVVFAAEGEPLGPVLVGVCGGVYLPQVARGEWAKVVANAASLALSMAAGAAVLAVLPSHWVDGFPLLLAAATLAAIGYFAVNTTCVSIAMARLHRRPVRDVALTLLGWSWHILPFAVLGGALGWLELRHGPLTLVLTVTPILVARQAFASHLRVREANEAALVTLVQALEAKDRYTAGHAARVAAYARYMGEELGLSARALERLRRAALMHDIGKLVVPTRLLNKPGRLTADEYELVRRHEEVTVELLGRIDFLAPVAPIALGVYADSLESGQRRSKVERHVIAVADAYDAMTSTRAYRRSLPQEVAFDELRAHAGTQFDPVAVDALIGALERHGLRHGGDAEPVAALGEWEVAPPPAGPGSAGLGDLADERAG